MQLPIENVQCKIVTIYFKDKNLQAQEISAVAVTGAVKINVNTDLSFLILDFLTADNKLVKQLCFAYDTIREYMCESIIWKPEQQ